MDLTFLINKEKCIQLKNKVLEELDSWNGMLDEVDEASYWKIIHQLEKIIENLK